MWSTRVTRVVRAQAALLVAAFRARRQRRAPPVTVLPPSFPAITDAAVRVRFEVQRRNLATQVVVVQVENAELREVADRRWDGAVELVERHVQRVQLGHVLTAGGTLVRMNNCQSQAWRRMSQAMKLDASGEHCLRSGRECCPRIRARRQG